jgi:hypothetical protein
MRCGLTLQPTTYQYMSYEIDYESVTNYACYQ